MTVGLSLPGGSSTMTSAPGREDKVSNRDTLSLSAQLRHSTRTIHADTETAFELDRWLTDRASYVRLLTLMWGFHTAAESALDRIDGWDGLTPIIDLEARRRAFRIEQDLAELAPPGATPVAPPLIETISTKRLYSIADGLGCLYVTEGSGLGGRVIADRAHAALGPRLPTTFFADPVRNLGRDWNGLRATLDAFGAGENATVRRLVIDAAHRTFDTFTAILVRGRSST